MRPIPTLAWVFAAGIWAAAAPARGGELTAEQQHWLSRAETHAKAGWIYLHIEGQPRERGFQHGYLLAPEIATGLRAEQVDWLHGSGMSWSWLIENTKGFIEPAIDPEDREEMRGIAEGMQAAGVATSYDEIVAYNAYFELAGYWWPLAAKKLTDGEDVVQRPKDGCSSFIATGRMTQDGGIVLGHNSMAPYDIAIQNVVIDIAPAAGHRILMQTQAGWIDSGSDFFITDAGLVGSETTIGSFDHFTEKGTPEFVRMRRATQDAGNIDAWCAIMRQGNNGGYANAWLIGDTKTGEIARLELGLKYVGFERTRDGYFIGSNIAEDLHILRLETHARDEDIRQGPVARRVRWKQLMAQYAGQIDLDVAQRMEADTYDVLTQSTGADGHTLNEHDELVAVPNGSWPPFYPHGSFESKVVDTTLARKMTFLARWGSPDGTAFDAPAFLAAHPQFDWMTGILQSRPSEPWAEFQAGEKH